MMLGALAGALVLSASPVQVISQSCPSGPEVEQALASMLPSVPDTTRRDVAHVTRAGQGLRIELVNSESAVIAERSLDVEGTCAELASLVAVVIATWESDVHPEFARSDADPIPAANVGRPIEPSSPPVARAPAYYDVAVGPALSLSSTFAAGGMVSGSWIARGTGLGLRVLGAGESSRTVDLEGGQARWRRWMGSLELDWRALRGRVALDLHTGLALSWLSAIGVGFPQNQSRTSFSPGAVVGVRASLGATRHFAVCLDLVGVYWTRSQSLYGTPAVTRREVPHFQALSSIGVVFRQSPPGQ